MKYLLLIPALIFISLQAFSQDSIPNRPEAGIESKIIELAMQNKKLEIADYQVKVAKYQLKQTKRWWLNEILLSFNANEFTVKRFQSKSSDNEQQYPYYPLYNLRVSIPIGGIFTNSMEVKSAREEVAISRAARDDKFNEMKSNVLAAYANYKQNKKLYALQLKSTESVFNEFLQAKQKFKMDQISLDDFSTASARYDDALKSKVIAEHNYQLSKIALEGLIGTSMENLLSNY